MCARSSGLINSTKRMKKQIIPTNNPLGGGVTQWADGGDVNGDWVVGGESGSGDTGGSGFSWNNLVSHMGNILHGVGSIVTGANNWNRNTNVDVTEHNIDENINNTTGRFSWSNGSTVTVIVVAGLVVVIALILVLGKK